MTIEFHKIWIEQCEGARGIKEKFETAKAIGYLIGEKLGNFVRASDTRPEFATELPNFVAEVKQIFEPHEIREYLENVQRIGAMGHVAREEEYEFMRKAGAFDENPVRGAVEVLIIERIKEMLLE